MQNQYFSLKSSRYPLFLRVSLSAVYALNFSLLTMNPCLAASYDMSDSSSSSTNSSAAGSSSSIPGSVNVNLSGGTGVGLNGATNKGNTNLTFSDFGVVPDSDPRSNDARNPADLLPISHQNTVTTSNGEQLQIDSYNSSQIKPSEWAPGVSGTSFNQFPMGNPGQANFYPGSRGSLPPVSSALQATLMPNAFVPITSGKSTDYQHYSFGFGSSPYNLYQGPYGQPIPLPGPIGSIGLGNSNSLPPTSLGSVDFNIRSK